MEIEPKEFRGKISIEVRNHGALIPQRFSEHLLSRRFAHWLSKPTVTITGAPHLNQGRKTMIDLSLGTVDDYVSIVRAIYPKAELTLVDHEKPDDLSRESLRKSHND